MSKTARAYTDFLHERLAASEEEAVGYLNAALEEGDLSVFLLALRDVVEARYGTAELAAANQFNSEKLSGWLAESGKLEFSSLAALLNALGMQLMVSLKSAA